MTNKQTVVTESAEMNVGNLASTSSTELELCIASTFTAQPLETQLLKDISDFGVRAHIVFAATDQLNQNLLSPSSKLMRAKVGVNLFLVRLEDFSYYSESVEGQEANNNKSTEDYVAEISENFREFLLNMKGFSAANQAKSILCICPASLPVIEKYGEELFTGLTNDLTVFRSVEEKINVIALSDYNNSSVDDYYDSTRDSLADIPYNAFYFDLMSSILSRRISVLVESFFKVIVLDADNTLWRGVCGEEKPSKLQIPSEFKELQEFMLKQRDNGMLLCLASKNEVTDVKSVFENNQNMVIQWGDIITSRINWDAKSSNIVDIARELNLGLGSFIFIDDNPVECAEVNNYCPEVLTLNLPKNEQHIPQFLQRISAYCSKQSTIEDSRRSQLYKENKLRESSKNRFKSLGDFIDSLELDIKITPVRDDDRVRVAQMTARTNQFNVYKRARNEVEVKTLLERNNCRGFIANVSDRFGDYGTTALAICEIKGCKLYVDTLLLSCRVLGRGVEFEIAKKIGEIAVEEGAHTIIVRALRSEKNKPAFDFLSNLNPDKQSSQADEHVFEYSPSMLCQLKFSPDILANTKSNELKSAQEASIEASDKIKLDAEQGKANSPLTNYLVKLFSKVCKIRENQLSINSNYDALGINSFYIIELFVSLEKEFGVLPKTLLFTYLNIQSLADYFLDCHAGKVETLVSGHSRNEKSFMLEPTNGPVNKAISEKINCQDKDRSLSYSQEAMFAMHQLGQARLSQIIPLTITIRKPVDLNVLEWCFEQLILRQDVLRSRFVTVDNKAKYELMTEYDFTVSTADLSNYHSRKQDDKLNELIAIETSKEFDLALDMPIRASLIKIRNERHILLITLHHLIGDGWSIRILFKELSALYENKVAGGANKLPEIYATFSDHVRNEKHRFENGKLKKQIAFWKQFLKAAPKYLNLPTDIPRHVVRTYQSQIHCFGLSRRTSDDLRSLSRETGNSLYVTLLSVFGLLLNRLSGQNELVVGSPSANRADHEYHNTMGYFANVIPHRLVIDGSKNFIEVLSGISQNCKLAIDNETLHFSKIVEALDIPRDSSCPPLVQVLFVLQNTPIGSEDFLNSDFSLLERKTKQTFFDLTLEIDDTERELQGRFEFNAEIFEEETVERFCEQLQILIKEVISNPNNSVSNYEILTDAETRKFELWNDTQSDYPGHQCIHNLFESQVAKTPNSIALVHDNKQLSFAELNRRANQLAHYLIARGVGPEVTVGICVERSLDMVIGLLGILKAGGCYIPLDPKYPRNRLAYIIEDSGIELIVTQESVRKALSLAEILNENKPERNISCVIIERDRHDVGDDNPFISLISSNLAYVIYTSGSTGKPKGVRVSHDSAVNFLVSMREKPGINSKDRLLAVTTLSFDIASLELFLPLTVGATTEIVDHDIVVSGEKISTRMDTNHITILQATPVTWRLLLESNWRGKKDLKALVGGEAFSSTLANELTSRVKSLWNMYGPTETTVWSSLYHLSNSNRHRHAKSVPIGKPIHNTGVYILDPQKHICPIGVPGELYIGGDGLSQGYFGRASLTAVNFVPNALSVIPGERIYSTGDLVRYLSDGNIEFLGRIGHQVKIRGFRIELGEIEHVLSQNNNVQDAVVVVLEESPSDKRLVAYVVSDKSRSDSENTSGLIDILRTDIQSQLPDYMIPTTFIMIDALPLTPNGKVDRKALPSPDRLRQQCVYVAPQGVTEELLASLWCRVLGVEQVSRYAHFFELGGHSLLVTQLMSRIQKTFSIELSLEVMFERQTLSTQAQVIERAQQEGLLEIVPIEVVSRDQTLSLSFAQQRLLFLNEYMGPNAVYNIPMELRLSAKVNTLALKRSIVEIVNRHEVLRTRFVAQGENAIQIIDPPSSSLPIETILSKNELSEIRKSERNYLFDLSKDILFRVRLFCDESESEIESDCKYILLVTMHHSVSDAWSLGIFTHELKTLYRAFNQGKPSPLSPLPIQYVDYAHWQRHWLKDNILESKLSYWRDQLQGLPPLINLPTDRPRPVEQSFKGSFESISLSANLSKRVESLSQDNDVTVFMTLLSIFSILISRYSSQDDVAIGTPIANRARRETEQLIGFFVNTLVMRIDLAGDPSFTALLKRIREIALQGYTHQELPFERLVEELSPERNMSYSPLIQVSFSLIDIPTEPDSLDDDSLSLEDVNIEGGTSVSRYDITFNLSKTPTGIKGGIEYDTELFDRSTIVQMLNHYMHLVEAITAAPEKAISHYEILNEREKIQQLVQWNDTQIDYPDNKCAHEIFEEQVANSPDSIALIYADNELGSLQMSYSELNRRANRLAHYLNAQGVGPEVCVGICVERSLEMVIGILGILKAGGAYVPLDPEYPEARLEYMLTQSACRVVLTENHLIAELPFLSTTKSLPLDRELHQMLLGKYSTENIFSQQIGLSVNNLAYVIYTSGSTGDPKGNCIIHSSINSLIFGDFITFSSDRTLLCAASLSFDAFTFELWGALLHGAKSVLIDLGQTSFKGIGEVLERYCVDCAWLTSALFNQVINESPEELANLKQLLVGGEALSIEHIKKAFELLPDTQLINGYGPTENTTFSCTYNISQEEIASLMSVPIGTPTSNTEAYILDKRGKLIAPGVIGELYLGGSGLSRGYQNCAGLTADKFVPDPFNQTSGARLYRTGDLVRYLPLTDDHSTRCEHLGNIEYIGRVDTQVKIRGFRIELGEVESALLKHAQIEDVAVVSREDEKNNKILVAYVVKACDDSVACVDIDIDSNLWAREIRSYLQAELPAYLIPSAIVVLSSLPLTSNGKLDRRALPAPQLSGVSNEYVAPEGEIECLLANLWCGVLKLERVGRLDNFFELGGHSLWATQLVSWIRESFSVELAIRVIFEQQTLEGQAKKILQAQQEEKTQVMSIKPVSRDEPLLLSYAQQRLWFLSQYMGPNAVYNMPLALQIKGTLNTNALIDSLKEIIGRHEALRTRFKAYGDSAEQIIDTAEFELEVEAVTHSDELKQIVNFERFYEFDLSKDNLCRIRLLLDQSESLPSEGKNKNLKNGDSHILLVTMHHCVSDAWSLAIFFRELVSLYEAFKNGQVSTLSPLTIQYADYSHWQREWLQGEVLENQLAYWRKQLADLPPLLRLPTDRPRPLEQTFDGSFETIVLPQDLSTQLQLLTQQQGVTLYMTLLSAFSVLLSRYSGQDDIVVGTPLANRNQQQTDGLIGFFVNTLVMRSDLSSDPEFNELLALTRETSLQAHANQDIPFEQLVEELRPERSVSYSPLYQVVFTLQNVPIETASLGDLQMSPLETKCEEQKGVSHFDLIMECRETERGIEGGMEYNTDLFDRSTIVRMLGHFQNLLEAIVKAPDTQVSKLDFVSQSEKQQQLFDWNASQADYPMDKCIHSLFETLVEEDSLAVTLDNNDYEISYGELNNRANKLANYLIGQGVVPEDKIGLWFNSSIAHLTATLGILKSGACCVPFKTEMPLLRLSHLIESCGVKMILTESAMEGGLDSDSMVSVLTGYESKSVYPMILDVNSGFETYPSSNPQVPLNSANLAYAIYVEDSKGALLGHEITHQNMADLVYNKELELCSPNSLLSASTLSYDASIYQLWRDLLQPNCNSDKPVKRDFREQGFREQCKSLSQPIAIGRAINNTDIYILDSQGQLAPTGAVGDLYLAGASVSRGLVNNASLTAANFVPNSFRQCNGERLYRTGDQVRYMTNGQLEFIGRSGAQLNLVVASSKIEKIESAIVEHKGVQAVTVVEREDEIGQKQLVCYVEVNNEELDEKKSAPSINDLRRYLRARAVFLPLPDIFVILDKMPLTKSGLIDKSSLPPPRLIGGQETYIEPETETERILCEIWQQKLSRKQVGITDNYFVLGGDSIRSISLVAEAKKRGLIFSIKDLFAYPSIRELASRLDSGAIGSIDLVVLEPFSLLTNEESALLEEQYAENYLEDAYPLSMMQQGMVLLSLKQPHLNVYENLQLYQFACNWDLQLFKSALKYLMDKHPLLKSVYDLTHDRQLQLVIRERVPCFNILDLRGQDEKFIQSSIKSWKSNEKEAGIDTSNELWRSTIFVLSENKFLFGMFIHHALWDGWSLESFITELYSVYAALINGNELPQDDALPSYSQFIDLEQKAMLSVNQRQYWNDKLKRNCLPWWSGRKKSPSEPIEFEYSVLTSQKMVSLAANLSVQEKSLWCSVYIALLTLLNGSYEVTGPVITQGRPEIPGGEKMVGVFLNALPIQVSIENKTWCEFILSIDKELREQHEFRYYPLAEIQQETGLDFSGSLFNYTNWHVYYEKDAEEDPVRTPKDLTKYASGDNNIPLKVEGWSETNYALMFDAFKCEKTRQFGMRIAADTAIFDEVFRRRIFQYVNNIIHQLEFNPEDIIEKRRLFDKEELELQANNWKSVSCTYPEQKCLHELFEEQVEKNPDAIALVYDGQYFESEQLSYGELNLRANQLAHYLIHRGTTIETRVGICMERSLDMVIGLLGILKTGACYVPLDPEYPTRRLDYIIKDSGVGLIVTRSSLLTSLNSNGGSETFLQAGDLIGELEFVTLDSNKPIKSCSTSNPNIQSKPLNLAYVIYTSGSTGKPKGVGIPHNGAISLINWSVGQLKNDELRGVLASTSICFDLSIYEIFLPLCTGNQCLIIDSILELEKMDQRDKVSLINTVPSAAKALLEAGTIPDSLRVLNLAGEPLKASLVNDLYERFSAIHIYDLYGPSEATTYSTYIRREPDGVESIGRPVANTEIHVLSQTGQIIPMGVVGELYIGGAGLSRGYIEKPSITAEKFMPNPFTGNPGERLYRTGDLVRYLPDGNLEFIGRIDHQVKVRGFRIELGEIENALLQHGNVNEAIVVVQQDKSAQRFLVAYVTCGEINKNISEASNAFEATLIEELQNSLRKQLPDYMIPTAFVVIDAFPLTSNGKVDRKALPTPDRLSQQDVYVSPEGATEELLASLWCSVLGLERVSRSGQFFELGGHSLLVTQLMSRIQQIFSIELSLKVMFEQQTLRSQAQMIVQAQQGEKLELVPIEVIPREQPLSLSFAQQRLLFLNEYMGANAVYNMPFAFRLSGDVNIDALRQSLLEIITRHEALRTRFETHEERWVQIIDPPNIELSVEVIASDFELRTILQSERTYQFNLSVDNLCRIRLILDQTDGSYILLVTMHHTVSDGWSMGIFFHELSVLYEAFKKGKPSPLVSLAIQYVDYAHWQRQWLNDEVSERQIRYWKEQLAGLSPLVSLPTDRPRPSEQTYRGRTLSFMLPESLSSRLDVFSREQGVTLFMTLLSCFTVLIGRYSGQSDIAIGTPIANRTRQETEELIGFFVNTLVMRSNLKDDPHFYELLENTRDVALQGYAHQDIPFEQLVEVLSPERSINHSPLFQVMFSLLNVPTKTIELEGVELSPVEEEAGSKQEGISRFDLTLNLEVSKAGLIGIIEYNTDLFDQMTIERIFGHYQRLLELVIEAPEERISHYDLLSDAEKHLQLFEWNDTQADYSPGKCIHQLFETQVEQSPAAVALVFENHQLSYTELNRRANQLAHYLIGQGVGPEVRVGLCMERSLEMVIGILAILKAGGAYMPLAPEYPLLRLSNLIKDSGVMLILSQSSVDESRGLQRHLYENIDPAIVCLRLDEDWGAASFSSSNPQVNIDSLNLAYIIYTSGSTGMPKGSGITHQNIARLVYGDFLEFSNRNILCAASPSFDAFTFELWGALLHGNRSIFADLNQCTFEQLGRLLETQLIDCAWLTSAYFNQIIDEQPEVLMPLKELLVGGEALSINHIRKALEHLPTTHLINGYGPTESTTFACTYAISECDDIDLFTSVPIGRPLANTQLYILDTSGQSVPLGVAGELHLGGAGLARGYMEKSGMTAERFVPHPYSETSGERLYRTGDLVRYLPDGNVEFLGRLDHQVKIRGFRIELGEIEQVLSQNNCVKNAVVLVLEEVPGDKRLVAYVVTDKEACDSEDRIDLIDILRTDIQSQLPNYMVPAAFVLLDVLPLTVNGKVDRKALPIPDRLSQQEDYIAPQGLAEELLARLWCSILNVKRVGRFDNFFESGGHSLSASQLVSRIRKAFQLELPVRTLFEYPNLQEQTKAILRAQYDKERNDKNVENRIQKVQKNRKKLDEFEGLLERGEL